MTMTLTKACELIQIQLNFKSGYNRNAVRLILAEIQRDHGQKAVDQLISSMELEEDFGLKSGTDFSGVTGYRAEPGLKLPLQVVLNTILQEEKTYD